MKKLIAIVLALVMVLPEGGILCGGALWHSGISGLRGGSCASRVETEYSAQYCRRYRTLYGAGTDGILDIKNLPEG